MKIKFEDNLDYQIEAVNSIVDLFSGQEKNTCLFTVEKESGQMKLGVEENELGIGNSLLLFPEEILKNLNEIQIKNCVAKTTKLKNSDYHFSVEMETGERVIIVMGAINVFKSRVSGTLTKYNSCIA